MQDEDLVTLVVNPTASRVDLTKVPDIAASLRTMGRVEVMQVGAAASPAADIARATRRGLIVVYGGDGTIHHVVRAAFADGARRQPLTIAALPGGYANVIARHAGSRSGPVEAARLVSRAWLASRYVTLPVAKVNGIPFVMCAGMGIDADIMRDAELRRRTVSKVSAQAYLSSGVVRYLQALSHRPSLAAVFDGEEIDDLRMVSVQRMWPLTYLLGRPLSLVPDSATQHDGLGVWALRSMNPALSLPQAARLFSAGWLAPRLGVETRTNVHRIEIHADRARSIQADGEYLGEYTQAAFTQGADHLRLLIADPLQ